MAKKKQAGHVAEICLYGNGDGGVGCGWLATRAPGGRENMLGDGEPRKGAGWTGAVFAACQALTDAGTSDGTVRLFAAGGERMAEFPLSRPPYFGEMKWAPAPVFVIDAADLDAAARK
jgi:hypothetical protein